MPKGILQFDLPEERIEFETACNGHKFKGILRDLDEDLRRKVKHGMHPEKETKIYETIRKEINDGLREENIDLYD